MPSQRQRQVIDFFFNGREGILPWFCCYDDEKKIVYPIVLASNEPSTQRSIVSTNPPISSNWLNIIQVEDLGKNVIFLVAKPDGLGALFDAYGHSWADDVWNVKRFVVIRNQFDAYPYLLILRKIAGAYKLYGGKITNINNPFAEIFELTGINNEISPFDIARFQNRVLFLSTNIIRGTPVLYWSKTVVQWSQNQSLNFFQDLDDIENEYKYVSFPEYFIVLPPSNFHFIWENFLVMSDGVYILTPTEIGGTFSLIFEKIFPISLPNEYGGGEGLDDIRAGFQYFKGGLAVSLRGKTYVFSHNGKVDIIDQSGVDTFISPQSPLAVRRLRYKHTINPYIAFPESWRLFKTDNFIIFASWNETNRTLSFTVFQTEEKGHIYKNRCYVITTAGSPFEIKYLRRIAPLRFYEIYIQTGQVVENPSWTANFQPPFILDSLIITEHTYEVGQKWVQTRDAGNTFIIDFEVPQTIQAIFEFEFDSGR